MKGTKHMLIDVPPFPGGASLCRSPLPLQRQTALQGLGGQGGLGALIAKNSKG